MPPEVSDSRSRRAVKMVAFRARGFTEDNFCRRPKKKNSWQFYLPIFRHFSTSKEAKKVGICTYFITKSHLQRFVYITS